MLPLAIAALLGACGGGTGHAGADGGTPDDAASPDAGIDRCLEAHATIGPEGGTLTLCDATLTVEAGQLGEPVDFTIERVDDPPALRDPFTIVGHAWRFTPERFADTGVVHIAIAHDSDRPLDLVRVRDGAWAVYGACEQTAPSLTQTIWPELGTFAAITDGRDLPGLPTGIGEATADLTLGEATIELSTGEQGYLTDEDALTGLRTFAFHAAEGTLALSLEIGIHPDGTVQPMFVHLADSSTGETWQMDSFANPDAITAEARYHGGALTATLEGVLYGDTDERPISIALTGEPGPWWREPPRFCPAE